MDEDFDKYVQQRVVLPIDNEKSKLYENFLCEVPEFEDPVAKERAEKGELILTEIAVLVNLPSPHRKMLHEYVKCWKDMKTNEVWDEETFSYMGKSSQCKEYGCVCYRKNKTFAPPGGRGGDRWARMGLRALRDATERELWEQQRDMSKEVDLKIMKKLAEMEKDFKTRTSHFKTDIVKILAERICEVSEEFSMLENVASMQAEKMDRLEKENKSLKNQLETLQQQFNSLSLSLTTDINPFNIFE